MTNPVNTHNEEHFRRMFLIHDAIMLLIDQKTGAIYDANRAAERFYGYPREKLCRMTIQEINMLPAEEVALQRTLALEQKRNFFIFPHRLAGGEVKTVEVHSSPINMEDKTILFSIIHDVTDRVRAEEELRQNRSLLDATEKLAKIGGWEWRPAEQRMMWTDETYRIHGMEPGEPAAGSPEHIARSLACYDPEDRPIIEAAFRRCAEEGQPYDLEFPLTKADGRRIWIQTMAQPVTEGGRVVKVTGNILDITDRKRAEEALRESKERFSLAFSTSPDAININRLSDGLYVDINEGFTRLTGFTRDDVIGRTSQEINIWCNPADRQELVAGLKEAGYYENLEAQFRRKDGSVTTALMSARVIVLKDIPHILSITRDISERKRAEEDYRMLFREMIDGFALHELICDGQGNPVDYRFLAVNPAFEKITGLKGADIVGRTVREVLPNTEQSWIDRYGKVALTGEPAFFENYSSDLKKHFEVKSFRPAPNQFACIFVDVTERKHAEEERMKLQEQLLQSQKMESVGRLAGGVAHDFNNMLGVILGHVEMAMEQVDPSRPLHADLLEIRAAAERSADLTRQLLAFARKQTVSPRVLDMNETVTGLLKMLLRLIGEDIELVWLPFAGVWPVRIDPSQIDQILANLSVNARDAIDGVGKITIETGNIAFDEDYCAEHAGFIPGEYVLLAVSDNGCGMDKEIFGKLFEPFFTTKEPGKGTGLGLATVYGIVKQNKGFINVYSEPDQGTTFRIYLPRYHGKSEAGRMEASPEPVARGHETVLVVEDEPAILNLTRRMLEKHGYQVLAAGSPGEAIRLAEEHRGVIHLLMTDVVLPEMNGRDLAKRMLSLYPDLKRLFMSGYTANVIAHHGVLDEGVCFLQKPFSQKDLIARVREAMDCK